MKRAATASLRTRVAICACGLLTFSSLALAEDDFQLYLDPIVLEVINSDVDTDSAKFNEYGDYGNGFDIPVLVIEGYGSETDRHLRLFGQNLTRDHARTTTEYGVWGKYNIWIDYNKIPHRFGNNAVLIWNQPQPGRLELPDSSQLDLQTAIETAPSRNFALIDSLLAPFIDSANRIDLGLQRNRLDSTIQFRPMEKVSWSIGYKRESRVGNRPVGGDFGFNNTQELPEPIDYVTTDASITGEWNTKTAGVQFGFRHSEFENDNDVLIWDNPFRAVDSTNPIAYLAPTTTTAGPSRGIYDLAPDNESDTLFLTGRKRFGDSWRASGRVVSTTMEQNDRLQAYTLNTAIVGVDYETGGTFNATDPSTLPAQNADLKVDVTALTADLGGDLSDDWKLKLTYDYYDYDPSVPRLEFDGYVRMHAVWEPIPRVTVPYDYTRETLAAKATWDTSDAGRLSFAYKQKAWDRTNRETQSTDEDIVKVTYSHRPGSKWNLRAGWETGDRTHDGYETEAQKVTFLDPEGINNQPGLRKYAQANREYDSYWADLYLYPRDAVQLMFGVRSLDQDYPEGEFGLLSTEMMSYNFEYSYAPGPNLSFFVFGNINEGESFQRSRQSGAVLSTDPDNDWELTLNEDNSVFGLGLNTSSDSGWSTEAILRWSDADGAGDFFTTPAGTPSSATDIANYDDTELWVVKVSCQYALSDSSRIGLRYWYEDYTLDSFLVSGLSNYESGLIALVPSFGDYTANVVGLFLDLDF